MKAPKTVTEPIAGKTMNMVLAMVRRSLSSNDVQSFAVTKQGFEVTQLVEEGEDVLVLAGSDDVDPEKLLETLQLETYPYDAAQHGMHALYGAVDKVASHRCIPTWIFAPTWGLLAAWLDIYKTEKPPAFIFGLRLRIVGTVTNDRIVVLGAPVNTDFLSDATVAVAIDMGV